MHQTQATGEKPRGFCPRQVTVVEPATEVREIHIFVASLKASTSISKPAVGHYSLIRVSDADQ